MFKCSGKQVFKGDWHFCDAVDEAVAEEIVSSLNACEQEEYPTEDAYMRVCRADHWHVGQLRANGIEPIAIPTDAPQYPPDDYDFTGGSGCEHQLVAGPCSVCSDKG